MTMKRSLLIVGCAAGLAALAPGQGREAEFKKLAAQIVAQRQAGGEEKEEAQARALALLDAAAVAALNAAAPAANPGKLMALESAQAKMQALLADGGRVGESYVLMQVGTEAGATGAPLYALVVNFGLSGPSAVRLYAPTPGPSAGSAPLAQGFRPIGKIDRFTHEDFFDEYLELVPVQPGAAVFVTVTGRTDDRKTGMFMAWRLSGAGVQNLWSSELLEHSSYEVREGEFRIAFCEEADELKPSQCKKMQQERYVWNGTWYRKPAEDAIPKTRDP